MRSLLVRPNALVGTLLASVLLAAVAGAAVHLALSKSEPANAATVAKPPAAITLWFTQRPNIKLTRLVLTHGPSDTIKTGAPAAVDTAGKQVRFAVGSVLAQGKYQVNWRTLARDGHAVAGKFAFSVGTFAGVESGSSSTAPKPR